MQDNEFVRKARAAGKKVMLFTSGTRGDVQPFVALADAFQKAGFIVQVPTNVNHLEFLRKFNLKAIPCSYDMEALLKQPHMVEFMANGNILKFLGGIGGENAKTFPGNFPRMLDAIEAFHPDAIWCSPLHVWEIMPVCKAKKIPFAIAALQCTTPSVHQQTMLGEPWWAPHKVIGYKVGQTFMDTESKVKNRVIAEHCPDASFYIPQTYAEYQLWRFHPYSPVVYAFSPSLYRKFPDWSADVKKQAVFTGFWIVSMAEQKQQMQKQDADFGGSAIPELTAFINAGTPPVYIGWGSMLAKSSEFMACLAIRSLMQAKLRAVVLGGWAELGLDKLENQSDTDAMKSFCKDNVIFMKTAPHEWLFPQCSVTVHHGGMGTVAAAIRAGKPTIITPVAFDQFENGTLAENGGSGIKTTQLGSLTVSELGAALTKCTSNKTMIDRAVELGEQLSEEDGLSNAVKVMDDWIMDEIVTGKYAALERQRLKEVMDLRAKHPGSCFTLANVFCGCGETDWRVKTSATPMETVMSV